MTELTPEEVERLVREYYAAKGWPDELWAMGLPEAVAFATHFLNLGAFQHTETLRQLEEADAVIASWNYPNCSDTHKEQARARHASRLAANKESKKESVR